TQKGDNMKFVSAAALALIGCLVGFNSANAQGAAMKTTPTTKILAIGTINPGFEQSQVFAVLPEEVRETVDLYLDGKIEQWYSLQGKPGVAFIINVMGPFWNCLIGAMGWLWLKEPVVYDDASFHLTSLSPRRVFTIPAEHVTAESRHLGHSARLMVGASNCAATLLNAGLVGR